MSGHAYTAGTVPPRSLARRPGTRGAASALGVAGLCVAGLALVWVLAALVPAARLKDAVALYDFTLLGRPGIDGPANFLLHLLDPIQFILWGVALVAVAIARERPRVAVAVAAVMGLAPLTSEELKPLLAHPHIEVGLISIAPASWPSGHSTAALALALSALLVTPRRLRPLVASVGVLFAVAVGCSLLILAWHMPSDVLGGYLVAIFWTALAVAALRAADRRWPPRDAAASAAGSGGLLPGA
jgi:membrane-associated phospholipid phosphatase